MWIRTHDFRRTTLTNLYRETKDVVKVKTFAGHASVTTTERYIQDDDDNLRDVVRGLFN